MIRCRYGRFSLEEGGMGFRVGGSEQPLLAVDRVSWKQVGQLW